MAANIGFALSVLTLGLCCALVTSSPFGSDAQDIENYLRDLKGLFRSRNTNDAYETSMEDLVDSQDEASMDQMKRFSPSGFVPVRGRRNSALAGLDPYGYLDERDHNQLRERLMNIGRYFQNVHRRRMEEFESGLAKRQPPAGFHAVRGKRSVRTSQKNRSLQPAQV